MLLFDGLLSLLCFLLLPLSFFDELDFEDFSVFPTFFDFLSTTGATLFLPLETGDLALATVFFNIFLALGFGVSSAATGFLVVGVVVEGDAEEEEVEGVDIEGVGIAVALNAEGITFSSTFFSSTAAIINFELMYVVAS